MMKFPINGTEELALLVRAAPDGLGHVRVDPPQPWTQDQIVATS